MASGMAARWELCSGSGSALGPTPMPGSPLGPGSLPHFRRPRRRPSPASSGSCRWSASWRLSAPLQRPHAVVLWVVRDLGQSERLPERRPGQPDAAAVALAQPVPDAHGVVRRAAPGLDGPLGRGLLLVGGAERRPVAIRLEHGVLAFDAAQVVAQLR